MTLFKSINNISGWKRVMSKIAIFFHDPYCSRDCVHGMKKALGSEHDVTIFNINELNLDFLKKFDMVAFPGGIGDADKFSEIFHWRKAQAIEEYVKSGGKYLGICMGAYWAGHHYFDILQSIEPVQYITQRDAIVRRSYGTAIPVNWENKTEFMFFYDGCCFVGDLDKTDIIATYPEGRPAAVIQGNVGLIGPHPESEKDWYTDSWNWSYMPNYWHHNKHHTLLLNFANRLLNGKCDSIQTQRTTSPSQNILAAIQGFAV